MSRLELTQEEMDRLARLNLPLSHERRRRSDTVPLPKPDEVLMSKPDEVPMPKPGDVTVRAHVYIVDAAGILTVIVHQPFTVPLIEAPFPWHFNAAIRAQALVLGAARAAKARFAADFELIAAPGVPGSENVVVRVRMLSWGNSVSPLLAPNSGTRYTRTSGCHMNEGEALADEELMRHLGLADESSSP